MTNGPRILRVPPLKPLSPMQFTIALLAGIGMDDYEIGEALSITPRAVRAHVWKASRKIPGDLRPYRLLLTVWARGGTTDVLTGAGLLLELRQDHRSAISRMPVLTEEAVAAGHDGARAPEAIGLPL